MSSPTSSPDPQEPPPTLAEDAVSQSRRIILEARMARLAFAAAIKSMAAAVQRRGLPPAPDVPPSADSQG